MSDQLIANLQSQINELTQRVGRLKSENIARRKANDSLNAELEQLRGQVGTLTTERNQFKAQAEAGPREQADQIAALQGQLRARDHRDAFAGVKEFEALGADGKPAKFKLREGISVDAMLRFTDYKAEGETPDAKAIGAKYGEAMKAEPGLFEPVAAAGETPAPQAPANGATSVHRIVPREAGAVGGGKRNESIPPARNAEMLAATYKASQRPGTPFGKIG